LEHIGVDVREKLKDLTEVGWDAAELAVLTYEGK
jgi:hypothetical protein